MTQPARAKFRQLFLEQARAECPNCPDKEVERRGEALYKAFYVRLSAAGVAGQRRKKAGPRPQEAPPSGDVR